MAEKIYIGCDVGTSSTKAVAADLRGTVLAESSKRYGLIQLGPNWAEQDPEVWLDAAVCTIRDVIAQVGEERVRGICISALYGGTGAVCGEDGKPVRPALIWMDRRAEEESRWVCQHIGRKEILSCTDNGTDSYYGYVKLLWIRNHEPENWKKIRWVLPSNSYIVRELTGELFVDYSSAGNFGGVYDYRRRCWSDEMCRQLGFHREWFPDRFCRPDEVVGTVTEVYREKLGLRRAVPVCAGTIDCIASMLSAGAVRPGDNAAVLGTSLNWGYIHAGLAEDANLISMPYCISPEMLSYTFGGTSTAGALPRWCVNRFMGDDSGESYAVLEDEVLRTGIPAGSEGLVVLPYFQGERTPIWDENATGVFFGMTLAHTRAHIYHAALEAVAYSLADVMQSMIREGRPVEKIVLVGGGARSRVWKQIFADVIGLPVYTPVNPVEAPLGDAFLAAKGTGAAAEFQEILPWITFHPPTLPDSDRHRLYEKYLKLYQKLYVDLKESMRERHQILTEY